MKNLSFKVTSKNWHIAFIMHPTSRFRFHYWSIIPIYLDVEACNITLILKQTSKLPCYFVTTLDIYNMLKQKDPQTNCYYFPHSISDKYLDLAPVKLLERKIDIIQLGRKSQLLHQFALDYCKLYPKTNYVYFSHYNEQGHAIYTSTTQGDILGTNGSFPTRADFINVLQRSKISLVSTPGQDDSRDFGVTFEGEKVDFFTARFYESCACYCYMIGRYTVNDESKLINIDSICEKVDTFKEFEDLVNSFLTSQDFNKEEEYKQFLNNSCTSQRAEYVLKILEKCGLAQ